MNRNDRRRLKRRAKKAGVKSKYIQTADGLDEALKALQGLEGVEGAVKAIKEVHQKVTGAGLILDALVEDYQMLSDKFDNQQRILLGVVQHLRRINKKVPLIEADLLDLLESQLQPDEEADKVA